MKVLILNYHRVCPGYHIDPETFERQIKTLKEKFIPLTLNDSVSFVKGKLNLKKDGFAITFDDGWADNFIYAYPILKKYNIPATIFIGTNFISNKKIIRPTLKDYWDNKISYEQLFKNKEINKAITEFSNIGYSEDFLTWYEINSMEPLIQVESHSHTHAYHFNSNKIIGSFKNILTDRQTCLLLSKTQIKTGAPVYQSGSVLTYPRYFEDKNIFENFNDYKNRVKNELETSITKIAENTGYRPKYLAWPFGEYNKTAIKIAEKNGFQACFTTKQGFIKQNDDYYRLRRFSPPKNHKIFLMTIKGTLGINFYRLIAFIFSIFKRV